MHPRCCRPQAGNIVGYPEHGTAGEEARGVLVEPSWNVMAHGNAREGKWRGNWRMEWVANTLHTTSEQSVSSITTADAHNSAASIRLNWRPCRFKWTRPFRRKTKSGFCAYAITFQTQSSTELNLTWRKCHFVIPRDQLMAAQYDHLA